MGCGAVSRFGNAAHTAAGRVCTELWTAGLLKRREFTEKGRTSRSDRGKQIPRCARNHNNV